MTTRVITVTETKQQAARLLSQHRILYGATVARFLQEVKRLLGTITVC